MGSFKYKLSKLVLMLSIKASPGCLLATEGILLDMRTVRNYYDRLKKGERIYPVVLVRDPTHGRHYPADGNHTSYAGLLANTDVDAVLLQTDADLRAIDLGLTKRFATLSELLVYCEGQNETSRKEIGVFQISDYGFLSSMQLQ